MTTAIAPPVESALIALPNSPEAEVCTVGCLALDDAAFDVVLPIVQSDDVFSPARRIIFDTLCQMHGQGKPIDLVLLKDELERNQTLNSVGGPAALAELVDGIPSTANVEYYAKIVRDKSMQRRLLQYHDRHRRSLLESGSTADAAMQAAENDLAQIREVSRTAPAQDRAMTAGELLAAFPMQREPVIDGLIRRGEVLNVISAPKMFKSWFVLHVALCVATGRDVFGFRSRPGRVLMIDLELAPGTLAKRLRAVAGAMNIPLDELGDSLVIQPLRGRKMDAAGLGMLLAKYPAGQFDLIVIDPLYRLFGQDDDENSNVHFAMLFGRLQAMAEKMDAGVLCVHHLTKGDQSSKAVTDLGSGGGSQARAADAHLALRPHAEDNAAVLAGVVRSFPPFDPFVIQWRYPLWEVASDLDPMDLRKPPPRRTRAPKEDAPPPAPAWGVPSFVMSFVTDQPTLRDAIIAQAREVGLTDRGACRLLQSAEATGKAFRWKLPKEKRNFYANRPQPILTGERP